MSDARLEDVIAEAMQRFWDGWCDDTGCVPTEFRIAGPPTTRVYADFAKGEMAHRVAEAVTFAAESKLAAAEAVIEAARQHRDAHFGTTKAEAAAHADRMWGTRDAVWEALAAYDRALSTTPRPTQAETLEFVRQRWPNRVEPIWRAAKCAEEAGECLGALNKPWLTPDDLRKETAQLAICVMALAESAGFDLNEAVAEEWAAANERTWPAALSTTPAEES